MSGCSQPNDSDHFSGLLQDFEHQQNHNTPQNRKTQRLAVQALLQAQTRNPMAAKIASEVKARPDLINLDRVITAFLTGPWAQVMARERVSGQGLTPDDSLGVFSLALDELLWSPDAEQDADQRQRLVKMIPGLVQSLRQELASIDFPAGQCQPFFDQLMTFHQDALGLWKEAPASPPKSGCALQNSMRDKSNF